MFNSFAKAIQKSSRQLMEVVCTHMFLTGAAKRQRDDWQEILLSTSHSSSLPYSLPTITDICPSHSLLHFLSRSDEAGCMRIKLTNRPTIPIRLQHWIRYTFQLLPKRDIVQLSRINKRNDPQKSRFIGFRVEPYHRIQ